jgi:hypothetical protein
MDRKVYFGNAAKQAWINAPQTGLQAPSVGFSSTEQLLSGRAYVKRSGASHRTFSPSWVGSLNDETLENSLQTVKDFADGLYGTGPFYWVDPYAAQTNLMPPNWAAPMLGQNDWPVIAGFEPTEYLATPTNLLNYPITSPHFEYSADPITSAAKKLRLIIPAGNSLFFGWHGSIAAGDGTVYVDRHLRTTGVIETLLTTPLSVTSSNRTNNIISGDVYSMVDIYISKTDAEVCDLILSGIIAQILPSTSFPTTGDFVSGRGTTGVEFGTGVQMEYYSSAVNNGQIGMSAEWIEV